MRLIAFEKRLLVSRLSLQCGEGDKKGLANEPYEDCHNKQTRAPVIAETLTEPQSEKNGAEGRN